MNSKFDEWLFKCRNCKHYYQVQKDADEVRCKLKICRFEPTEEYKEMRDIILADKKSGKESGANV